MRAAMWTEAARLRPLWLGILVTASAALTTAFTCITPFAAFAVIVATTLAPRQALSCTIAIWLANQAVGFGVLNYPRTATTFAWGVAIGGAAVIATLGARWTVGRLVTLRAPFPALAGFVASFGAYQAALYAIAVSVLGGTGAFAPRILGHVLLVNAVALVGLFTLHRLVLAVAVVAHGRRAHVSDARRVYRSMTAERAERVT